MSPVERAYFVPGRVELFGKHTDYAGGRSLICAIDRGLRVRSVPRNDSTIHVESAGETIDVPLAPDAKPGAAGSSRYVATVARRLSADLGISQGADITIESDLPEAAGLSSSSAFVVAIACALLDVNDASLGTRESLAQYLGSVETGVGTHGGSQDHAAILCSRAGEVAQYSFAPVRCEARVPFPAQWTLAVAVSGIHAHKTGDARALYNRAAADVAHLCELWREETNRTDATLAQALASSPAAQERLSEIAEQRSQGAAQKRLLARITQFAVESGELVPEAAAALVRADLTALQGLAERSRELASTALENGVPETMALVARARELGAAASAFGAGFGGSVWAVVPKRAGTRFLELWSQWYRAAYPVSFTSGACFFDVSLAQFSTACTATRLPIVENEGASCRRS